jgi:hypothetical protein
VDQYGLHDADLSLDFNRKLLGDPHSGGIIAEHVARFAMAKF